MANRIKGITIEIGGDTTGLDKALRGVNFEIKTTQNDLKEVEKSLKLDPGNVELLEQKQRALNKAVDATKEKLDTLKEAQRQMASSGITDENRAQYEALTREIVNTEDALKKATDAQQKFNAEAEVAKSKLSGLSESAGRVADATKGMSTAAAGVVAGIGALALKSAAAADDLNSLSKQSGLTTEELQKMQYASDLVDVSMDAMVGAQTKLRRSMSGTGEVFAKLGVAVKTSDGQMRDSTEVFYETLEALSRVGNETERDQLAMEVFGRSADQLAGIIDDGGAALKQYGDEAERLGLIMDQETLDSLNKVNDEIDKLKAQAKGELAKAGAAALEALAPVIQDIVNGLSSLLSLIGNMSPAMLETILIVASVVAAISPVAGIISSVTGALSGLLDLWPAIAGAGAKLMAFVAANPILLIIAAIAALAAVIITHWDEIRPVLEAIWETIKEVIGNIIGRVKDFTTKLKDAFNDIKDKFVSAWETVRDGVTGVFTAIADNVKEKINAVIGFVNQGITAINNLIEGINNSGLGKTLGINIGSLGTIPTLQTSGDALLSQNGRSSGSMTSNTYNTSNVYNQIPQQPINVNLNLDGNTLARQMVSPMRSANAAAGSSNMI